MCIKQTPVEEVYLSVCLFVYRLEAENGSTDFDEMLYGR
jgi:hypothetical protein